MLDNGSPNADGEGFSAVDRQALRAIATQFFVNGALFASFMPRMPEIRDRIEVSTATIGLMLSIAGLSGLAGSAAVGPAIGRFGTRSVILAAGSMVALSLAVVGVAPLPALLLLGLVGMSTFDVLVDVGMNMQGSWLSARRHAPVMNRLHGLWSLGTLVGGLASSRLAAAGVSLTVHLVSAAVVLLLVIAYVGRGLLRTDELGAAEPEADDSNGNRRGQGTLLLVLFGLAGFFAVAMEATSIDWAAFRLSDDFDAAPGFAALGYVAVTGGMTVSRFGGDWVVARIGDRRLVLASIGLAGVGLALASLAPDRFLTIGGYLLAGIGVATLLPTLYDAAAQHPGRPGAGLGALTGGLRTAGLLIPLVVGGLAGLGLAVGTAIALVTLPSAVGFFIAIGRLRPGPSAPPTAG